MDCGNDISICNAVGMQDFVNQYCQKTCQRCGTTTVVSTGTGTCTSFIADTSASCRAWATNGFCTNTFYTAAQRRVNEDDDDGGSGETRLLQYSICVNGIRQAATCSDGYVFYEYGCVPVEYSPECQLADDTEEEPYNNCTNALDGLYAIGNCESQFLTCSGGIARIMDCPANLICDWRHNVVGGSSSSLRKRWILLVQLVMSLIQRFDQMEAKVLSS
ncbi:unnamed protein product [Caenorhabditis nigoni]